MKNKSWMEAIIEVLNSSKKEMHYEEIAEEIIKRKLRNKVGATPASSVNKYINSNLNEFKNKSLFEKVERGIYKLRKNLELTPKEKQDMVKNENISPQFNVSDETFGLIKSFGVYWEREDVAWNANVKLLGTQTSNSKPVNFSNQNGLYILYDGRTCIYVGLCVNQGIGERLLQHTKDRLRGRWDRFSWFGFLSVSENGTLVDENNKITLDLCIKTMESLLIESLEPPLNRKRGQDFGENEWIQESDPEIEKRKEKQLLEKMVKQLKE